MKTERQLKRLSERQGVSVTRKSTSKPPSTEIPGLTAALKAVAGKIEISGDENTRMLKALYKQMNDIKLNTPQPITEWDFTIIRDKDGISKINAKAVSLTMSRH